MGNNDGILEAIASQGQNKKIPLGWGQFSFAFGNEIALCVYSEKGTKYYILNCDGKLWGEVNKKVGKTKGIKTIKKWWLKKSETQPINSWSGDFDDLGE